MVVRIRLARFGRKNQPIYNIVVTQARCARGSRPMEVLGTYDPTPKTDRYDTSGKLHKDIQLDLLRAKYWIGVGAQPSDRVWSLLSMAGILEPKRRPAIMNKLAAQSGGIATKPVEESESSTAGEAGAEPTKS